jgi:hypothetical protein
MLVPIEMLIDGVVRTLTEHVLPDVEGRFARGQLYAAVDVLRNLRDRVETRIALDEAEADSAAAALERVIAIVPPEAGRALAAARDAAPPAPAAERAPALRAALVVALEAIDALPEEVATAARAAVLEHLAAQALRDVMVLKPSLLTEISKG